LRKFKEKTLTIFGYLIFLAVATPAASRSGFYPAAAAVKKVTAKSQSQPPGKNSTAETSSSDNQLNLLCWLVYISAILEFKTMHSQLVIFILFNHHSIISKQSKRSCSSIVHSKFNVKCILAFNSF
jgi:hypothetical protein